MIRLDQVELEAVAAAQLVSWQGEIDRVDDFRARVEAAQSRYKACNRDSNPTFRVVRSTLRTVAGGLERCAYCDDSLGHQIEHFRPKSAYPGQVFAWPNLLLACGCCNNNKGKRFAILVGEQLIEIAGAQPLAAPPEEGADAVINPRYEDPLEHLELDLAGTFYFVPRDQGEGPSARRARYTIQLLGLNARDGLVQARRAAAADYRARAWEYVRARDGRQPDVDPTLALAELRRRGHRAVWQEMKRSAQSVAGLPELFECAPELLTV